MDARQQEASDVKASDESERQDRSILEVSDERSFFSVQESVQED